MRYGFLIGVIGTGRELRYQETAKRHLEKERSIPDKIAEARRYFGALGTAAGLPQFTGML